MKVFVCLFALIACASANALPHSVIAAPALISSGSSTQSRTQDAAGNYAFAYNEQHATGGSSRKESGSPGVAVGSYTLNVADGRQRVVNYQADALGFRAAIATNEPGTAAQNPANVAISSPHLPPAPVAPLAPVAVAAPLVQHAPVLHAPVVHHAPVLHAPVVHHAPVLHAPVHAAVLPAVSSYASSINHAHAAPLVHLSAPLLHAAPAHLHAPALHY